MRTDTDIQIHVHTQLSAHTEGPPAGPHLGDAHGHALQQGGSLVDLVQDVHVRLDLRQVLKDEDI